MKLLESILLALSTVATVIGIHQLFYYSFEETYWIISLAVLLFLLYTFVKSKNAKREKAEEAAKSTTQKTTASSKKKRKR